MKNEIRKQYRDNGLCDELVERIEIIDFTDYKMLMVKHPLMNECLMDVNVEPFWKNKLFNKELQKVDNYCDFLNKSLNVRTRGIRECIDKKDWGGITYFIHESGLWNWFIHNHFDLDDDGYFYLIKMMWVLDEQTNNQLNWLNVDELIDLFTYRGNPHKIMDDDDLDGFNKLDDELTLYRGVGVDDGEVLYTDKEDIGISFTTDKEKGIWFGRRFGYPNPYLLEITINKKDVFFYTDDRNEKEVVVNPYEIKTIKIIELEKD